MGVARSGTTNPGISTPFQCPAVSPNSSAYGLEVFGGGQAVPAGSRAFWEIDAPAGFAIIHAHTEDSGMVSYGVNQNMGWGGGFYWQGGGAAASVGEIGYSSPAMISRYFGWQIICGRSKCDGVNNPSEISILGLEVEAAENAGPTVSPSPGSLGTAGGWVRGWWPISFTADGPTGACQLAATLGGVSVSQPVNEPQNQVSWHQCPGGSFSQLFNTGSLSSGAGVPLVMWARDAGYDYSAHQYLAHTATRAVNIDNQPVGISLSGPTDAPTTAGTQYVTAKASAGPSRVAGIGCSLDGGAYRWYSGASTRVPVSGLGVHHITCYAANNARDASGAAATSPPQSWTLSIRQPTVGAIAFTTLVDAMRCRRIHGRSAPNRGRGGILCHPRIVARRVRVWQTTWRHGQRVRVKRTKVIKVAVLPHYVTGTTRHVPHGHGTTVTGWLGTAGGTALGGEPVEIFTAPDDGLGAFQLAAAVTTAADGAWVANLPPGPSRLVEAVYPGSPLTEPATSAQVRIIVPAKIELISVRPQRVPWGGTVQIVGQLVGGYLPRGGALVRLRIGSGRAYTTYGVQTHVTGDGRFTTPYTFGAGLADVHQSFWFQVASLPMGAYPYTPAASRRVPVFVGGHPDAGSLR